MLNKHTKISLIIVISVFALGCNSTQKNNTEAMGKNIPQWVLNPSFENGLAATSCVIASNSYSMDKAEVATQARDELASQIETRVSSLQTEYLTRTSSIGNTTIESKFSSISTQLTDQYLNGSQVTKIDYAQIAKVKNLCAMVTLSEETTKELFGQFLKQAPIKLDTDNEKLLYSNFIKPNNLAR
jgi:hypothetical protein